jgi:hypothetical protein
MRFAGEIVVQLAPGVFLKLADLESAGGDHPITAAFESDYYKGSVKVYSTAGRDDPKFQLKADIKWVGLGMRFDAEGLDLLEHVSRVSKWLISDVVFSSNGDWPSESQ